MTQRCFLGIDNGTQGLTVLLVEETTRRTLAIGEGSYQFSNSESEQQCGVFEQTCEDWEAALQIAMQQVRDQVPNFEVLAIGISGQMHGEVLLDDNGNPLGPVRLWCDARNDQEGEELTRAFQSKVPKRMTCARFLWTARNQPDKARKTKYVTTPAGWFAYRLTGQHLLGIGDAAGMFPVDSVTQQYDQGKIQIFDDIVNDSSIASIQHLLPNIRRAGQDAGSTRAGNILGLKAGIPVASAEGDQVCALAGSLIGDAGMLSCSFGTSVCANAIGDRTFVGVSAAVDTFAAADGKPINMVWLRNGTTFFNTIVKSYGGFDVVIPQILAASDDCGGLLALPFMNDEPSLGATGGNASLIGFTPENTNAGNAAKAALVSTMFNLKNNCQVLKDQGYPMTEIVLSGGLVKTPECAQILANVFNLPVKVLETGDEGCAWGAAIMAQFRYENVQGNTLRDWQSFLHDIKSDSHHNPRCFLPDKIAVTVLRGMFERYQKLLARESDLHF